MTDKELKEISDGMAMLTQRLAKAGWITGMNITTLESTSLHQTPIGKKRFAALQKIMEVVMAKAATREGPMNWHEGVLLGALWLPVLSELMPPPITLAEYKALCGWMSSRAFNL